MNSFLRFSVFGLAVLGADLWRDLIARPLAFAFGPAPARVIPTPAATLLFTLASYVALELGYYAAHRLAHRTPLLWRFHRLHHSADVLTPLTGFREHPVDTLLFGTIIGLCVGGVGALLAYPLGAGVAGYSIFGMNLFLFAFGATVAHLRHSSLWLPFSGWGGCVFQSPAHHQLHHSRDPRDHDCNFGYCLSIFDWACGTLALPCPRRRLRFGLHDLHAESRLRDFYLGPFAGESENTSDLG